MTEVACLVLSELLLLWCFATRPTSWRSPAGWYVEGVRPDGRLDMRPSPGGDPDDDGTWQHPDVTPDDPRAIDARIYCTGGARPVIVDARVAGCQR